jgi:hypothetical protein
MAKIKNMGTATARFKEGLVVTGSAGTDVHTLAPMQVVPVARSVPATLTHL